MKSTIKLSDIKIKFGGKNLPKDKKFLELYKKAYNEQIHTYWGMVNIDGIKPFSNYHPEISQDFIDKFHQRIKSGKPSSMYVYLQNDSYMMSDDYSSYYLYLYSGYKKIPCYILGEPEDKYISDKVGPIKLPELQVEVTKL
ncbi:MAG: hypothetical protein G01um10145_50 [Microgenomates group bacterium Gr01-1014_5]|nr:MAG: hypothetical protein G01um10145_50 [Microgenomates group bacterium Gr01-1014_5]